MTVAIANRPAQPAATFLGRLIDAIRINAINLNPTEKFVVKHRTWLSRRIANLANLYFAVTRIPIRFCIDPAAWQKREIDSFRLLNPGYAAYERGKNTLCAERLQGRNLFEHLEQRTLTRKMLVAAGLEYRRAHAITLPGTHEGWTHADATMANVIYDRKTRRARLIDFELHHVTSLPLDRRRADDLLVFLLDLVGYASDQRWLPMAKTFLEAYGDEAVIDELVPMLKPPRRLARIWFGVRTNWQDPIKIAYRLNQLRRYLTPNHTMPTTRRIVTS